MDIDGCAGDPCIGSEMCIDLKPNETLADGTGYQCSGCIDGFSEVDGECLGRSSALLLLLVLLLLLLGLWPPWLMSASEQVSTEMRL